MPQSIQVSLIEDNPEYREVVKLSLESAPDVKLHSQFGTAEIALRTLSEEDTDPPDLILLDIRLPGIDGNDAIPELLECFPETKIVVLTQSDNEIDVLKAISNGAAGYLLKSVTLAEPVSYTHLTLPTNREV